MYEVIQIAGWLFAYHTIDLFKRLPEPDKIIKEKNLERW